MQSTASTIKPIIANLSVCHIISGAATLTLAILMITLQSWFLLQAPDISNWGWPSHSLPSGYIAAGMMLLTAIFTLIAGRTQSRDWLLASFVFDSFTLIVTFAVGISGFSACLKESPHHLSIVTISTVNLATCILTTVHLLMVCANLCECTIPSAFRSSASLMASAQSKSNLRTSSTPVLYRPGKVVTPGKLTPYLHHSPEGDRNEAGTEQTHLPFVDQQQDGYVVAMVIPSAPPPYHP